MTIAEARAAYGRAFSAWMALGGMFARDARADLLLEVMGDLDTLVVCRQLGCAAPRFRVAAGGRR